MGDTVAVFSVHTEEAKKEAEKLMLKNNIFSHKYIGVDDNILPYQDNCLGLYLLDHKHAL